MAISTARKRIALTSALVVGGVVWLPPTSARAHFKLDAPASWMSQTTVGGPQKNGPCAATPNAALGEVAAGTPTGMVTAVQKGQTVSVSVTATIAHPGWWRIALVQGASSTQTLTSLPDPQPQAGTNCTPAIMSNPVWSPTQPVIADGLPAGSTAQTTQSGAHTFQVTIPQNATCTSANPCTLQVIMVMTDHPAGDCYYHHCADISATSAGDGGGGSGDASLAVGADASFRLDGSGAAVDSGGSGIELDSSLSTSSGGSSGAAGSSSSSSSSGSGGGMNAGGSNGSSGPAGGPVGGGSSATNADASTAGTASGGGGSSGGCLISPGGGTAAAAGLVGLAALMAFARRRRL